MTTDQKSSLSATDVPAGSSSETSSGTKCGACQTVNATDSKFCACCGQSLYEPCFQCKESVSLTQRFCGSCGADLEKALNEKRAKYQALVEESVDLVKKFKFDQAVRNLKQVITLDDFRLAEPIRQAEQALQRVTHLQERTESEASDLIAKADAASKNNDHERVVNLLSKLPDNLLTESAQKQLRQSKSIVEQVEALNAELQAAMKARDWKLLGSLVNQLLVLAPENTNYQQIAVKVGQRLFSNAKKHFAAQAFARAASSLDSIPDCQRGEMVESFTQQIADLQWMESEIEQETFATIGLGRLAVRFAKQCENEANSTRVKEMAKLIKTTPEGRHGLNLWRDESDSWIGGKIGLLGQSVRLQTSKSARQESLKHPGLLNVAIGLALQGVDAGRISENFLPAKKGLLKSLSRQKAKEAWGVDLGSSGLRAVRIALTEEDWKIEDVYVSTFDTPACRTTSSDDADSCNNTTLVEALQHLVLKYDLSQSEVPVWVNLPSQDVVNRSIRLPPLKDKAAMQVLDQETSQLLPMDSSELSMVRWLAPLDEETSLGRPAVVAAARKSVIQKRQELMEASGLKVAGFQSDALAIANYVAFEFAEDFQQMATGDRESAIAVADCGCLTTSLVIVTSRSVLAWTFENAGEEMTKALARELKQTLAEAQQLKHDPAAIKNPSAAFEAMDEKTLSLKQRLEHAVAKAKGENSDLDVVQTWVMGGASRGHGWVRKLIAL